MEETPSPFFCFYVDLAENLSLQENSAWSPYCRQLLVALAELHEYANEQLWETTNLTGRMDFLWAKGHFQIHCEAAPMTYLWNRLATCLESTACECCARGRAPPSPGVFPSAHTWPLISPYQWILQTDLLPEWFRHNWQQEVYREGWYHCLNAAPERGSWMLWWHRSFYFLWCKDTLGTMCRYTSQSSASFMWVTAPRLQVKCVGELMNGKVRDETHLTPCYSQRCLFQLPMAAVMKVTLNLVA